MTSSNTAAEAAALRLHWPDFGAAVYDVLPLLASQRAALADGLRQAGLPID